MEVITRDEWRNIFKEIAKIMEENVDLLTEIDAKFGDGDHGTTILKISKLIEEKSKNWYETNKYLKDLFEEIGSAITNSGAGSAGPLYGTYFEGFKEVLNEEVETDAILLKKMLVSGLTELSYLTTAKVGDKTLMDTLIPATIAAENSEDNIINIISNAKEAAVNGTKDSEKYISKFGRARLYGEQTIGTPDAGAQSASYIFIGMYNALNK